MLSSRAFVACCLVLTVAAPATACRCIAHPPPLVELEQRDVVFSGVVTALCTGDVGDAVATIEITRCWKGDIGGAVTVVTPANSAACGVEFEVGAEYLVYADRDRAGLHTHLCTRTRSYASADVDLAELGEPACFTAVEPETWGRVKRLYD